MHSKTILRYGLFSFKPSSGSFDKLKRTSGYRLSEVNRIGRCPAIQVMGEKLKTIDISGVWFPEYHNSWNLEKLELQGKLKVPLPLISASGKFYGFYLLESLNQTEEFFNRNAKEMKQSFNIKLKEFGLDLLGGGLF